MKEQRTANITYTQAGVSCFVGQESAKFQFTTTDKYKGKEWTHFTTIKKITEKQQEPYIKLVDKILSAKIEGKDSIDFEKKIDELVYKLYDITPDEQKIIEGQ